MNAIKSKKPAKGKSTGKGKKVPETPPIEVKKPHFEVLIRIPWEAYDVIMEFGKRNREVTFNGSLKSFVPAYVQMRQELDRLKTDHSALQMKHKVESGILSRFRGSLREILEPVPAAGPDGNFQLPLKSRDADYSDKIHCLSCNELNDPLASVCVNCGDDLEEQYTED